MARGFGGDGRPERARRRRPVPAGDAGGNHRQRRAPAPALRPPPARSSAPCSPRRRRTSTPWTPLRTAPTGPPSACRPICPLTLVVHATRSGPGWGVDLYHPLAAGDSSPPIPSRKPPPRANGRPARPRCACSPRRSTPIARSPTICFPIRTTGSSNSLPTCPPGTTLHCPSDPGPGISYAMNANLAGKRRWQVADPESVPVFYESTAQGREPRRHRGGLAHAPPPQHRQLRASSSTNRCAPSPPHPPSR